MENRSYTLSSYTVNPRHRPHRGTWFRSGLFILLGCALAAPLLGGTVYVPLVTNQEFNGHTFKTEVRVTNNGDVSHTFTFLYLAAGTDGTIPVRASEAISFTLGPHQTVVSSALAPEGGRGVLEITGPADIAVAARLLEIHANGGQRLGAEMPVVTSANRSPGNEAVMLQGLQRKSDRITDGYVLSIGIAETSCTLMAYRRSGFFIGEMAFTIPPFSLHAIEDVLQQMGEDVRTEVSVQVICDRRFYPFAVVKNRTTAESAFILPSGLGTSGLEPPDAPPPVACPAGALFEIRGAFHTPSVGQEDKVFAVPVTPGQIFTRLTIDLDFRPGDWNAANTDGNHNIVWANRGRQWPGNVMAYVNAFGPGKNFIKISTNGDLPRGADLRAFTENVVLQKGEEYHVHYIHDTSANLMEAVFTINTGTPQEQEVVRVTGTPTAADIDIKEDRFFFYFGHPTGTAGPEVPTYGWQYKNLCVQLE